MIVVDTNIIAHTWLPSQEKEKVRELIKIDHEWISPILWRSEMRSVLSKYMRKGLLSEAKANEIAQCAEEQMSGREFQVPTRIVLSKISSSKLSSYDCEFITLAQMKGVKLITFESKIPKEFPELAIDISDFIKKSKKAL